MMVLFAAAGAAATEPSPAQPSEITPGIVHPVIACAQQPGNSYALYLPAGYTPQKKWPIIYAFDPGARGEVPVRLYKDVAEKYGYILAGSNNAQNFDAQAQSEGTRAMLDDTLQRFSVDMERIYKTGFSGGARMKSVSPRTRRLPKATPSRDKWRRWQLSEDCAGPPGKRNGWLLRIGCGFLLERSNGLP